MQILGEAWERTPGAQDWLHDVLGRLGLIETEEDEEPRSLN